MDDRGASDADETRFHAIFTDHFTDVWRYLRRRCASSVDADDLTAETFATAWRRRGDLPDDDAVRLWLFGTARNILANHDRGARRRARLRDKVAAQPVVVVADSADATDDAGVLWRALAELADDDRELLLLRAWDGLAVAEIAELAGCTPNAASQRLARARTRLADALGRATDPAADRTGTRRVPEREGGRP